MICKDDSLLFLYKMIIQYDIFLNFKMIEHIL